MTDVLIVGAGPVGLTVAHELARRGVRVRLVDGAGGPATTSRAIATHPRTLETYDQMGIVDDIIAKAVRITAFTLFADGRRLVRLDADYTEIPTRFPFTLAIDQVLTEGVLREAVARQGVTVEWGVRLRSFAYDDDSVTVSLEHTDGKIEDARVGWLVGCDGGHSTVRKQLGLPLIGESSETWLIADATVHTELPPNSIYWIRAEGGTLMMAPLPGERRWRMLDTVEVDSGDDADAVAERFSRKLTAGVGSPVRVDPPGWVSVFTAQQRMVPQMRAGRVFVAGDAAHVHSPASGQGMNTGVQEAFNLAWKLAMVIHGEAGESLLDTYSAERVPIGAELLDSTKNATALVALKSRFAAALLPIVFGIVQRIPALKVRGQRKALGRVAGLNIGYPDGPLTRPAPAGAGPRPGDRVVQVGPEGATAPGWAALVRQLREPGWTLVVFGESNRDAADRARWPWLTVRVAGDAELPDPDGRLAAGLGVTGAGWLLIRPDGYLAARGTELTDAELTAAFAPLALPAAERTLQ